MAKATAVRNIRDDHQKAFLKIFNSLCGRFNRWQVWQDFVMVTAIEISNATDKQNAPERTKTYQTIISKYSDGHTAGTSAGWPMTTLPPENIWRCSMWPGIFCRKMPPKTIRPRSRQIWKPLFGT